MARSLLSASTVNGNSQNFTISAGSSRMAIVGYHLEYTTAPSSVTATLGGTSIPANGTVNSTVGVEGIWGFYVDEATLTTIGTGSKQLVFTATGGSGFQGQASSIVQWAGAAQTAPPVNGNGNAAGSNPLAAVTLVGANAALVGFMAINNTGATTTNNASDGSSGSVYEDSADSGGDNRKVGVYREGVGSGSKKIDLTISTTAQYALLVMGVDELGAGGTAYTLTAAQGSYSLVGSSGLVDLTSAAAQGSYALTGQAISFTRTLLVAAVQGLYTLTGQAAAFSGLLSAYPKWMPLVLAKHLSWLRNYTGLVAAATAEADGSARWAKRGLITHVIYVDVHSVPGYPRPGYP